MSSSPAPHTLNVICVGNAIVDALATVDDADLETWGLVKGSMDLIDADRADALYGARTDWIQASGGSGANTAAGLASLGSKVAYVGRVRDDDLGHFFVEDMRRAGITFDVAPAGDGPGTARCMVMVTPDAQRTMNTFLGASAAITTDSVDPELVARAAICYGEGYLWDAEPAKATMRLAFEIARSAGRRNSLTLSDSFCVERHRDSFLDLLDDEIDIVFANEAEALCLFETEDVGRAAAQLAALCPTAVMTRSEAGCIVVENGERVDAPAHPVAEVVDTTGAGDLFAAGFLHGVVTGADTAECARLGAVAAAEVISHIGPRPEVSLADLV